MKKVQCLKYGIEYDYDECTGFLSKVLTCHHVDGSVTYDRFEYEYIAENFSKPY